MIRIQYYLRLTILSFCCSTSPALADCGKRLDMAAEAASALPNNVGWQVTDSLSDQYEAALEVAETNPSQCLAMVAEMEATIQRYSGAMRSGSDVGASANSDLSVESLFPPSPKSARLAELARSASPAAVEDANALAEYRDAAIARGFALAQQANRFGPAAQQAVVQAAMEEIAAAESAQEIILVNDEGDQLHAQLEDALRELDDAKEAVDRLNARYDGLTGLDAETQQAVRRLNRAHARLQTVRNRLDQWLDEQIAGMRPGFERAADQLLQSYKPQFDAAEKKCDVIMQQALASVAAASSNSGFGQALAACRAVRQPVWDSYHSAHGALEAEYALEPSRPTDARETLRQSGIGQNAKATEEELTEQRAQGQDNARPSAPNPQLRAQLKQELDEANRQWDRLALENEQGARHNLRPAEDRLIRAQAAYSAYLREHARDEYKANADRANNAWTRPLRRGADDMTQVIGAKPQEELTATPSLREYDGPAGTNPDHVLSGAALGDRARVLAPGLRRDDQTDVPSGGDLPEYDGPVGTNPDHILGGAAPGYPDRVFRPGSERQPEREEPSNPDLQEYDGPSGTNPDHVLSGNAPGQPQRVLRPRLDQQPDVERADLPDYDAPRG